MSRARTYTSNTVSCRRGGFCHGRGTTLAILTFSSILFTCGTPSGLAQTKWFKYDGNPILDGGSQKSWDRKGVEVQRVIFGDTLRLWYTGYGPKLALGSAYSTDGGVAWSKLPGPILSPTPGTWDSAFVACAYVMDAGSTYKMWYGGYDGATFRIGFASSNDRGVSWIKHPDPLLGAGKTPWTSGGVYYPSIIPLSERTGSFLLSLAQNYPNPFNPSTTIRYVLPQRSRVHLSVYNTLGQQVAELVNGEIDAGYHEVRFAGSNLSSGVYFYRLQAAEFVQTKSLVILR